MAAKKERKAVEKMLKEEMEQIRMDRNAALKRVPIKGKILA